MIDRIGYGRSISMAQWRVEILGFYLSYLGYDLWYISWWLCGDGWGGWGVKLEVIIS